MRQIEGNYKVYGALAALGNERANELFDNKTGNFSENCKEAGILGGEDAIQNRREKIVKELSTIDDEIEEAEDSLEEAQEELDSIVKHKTFLKKTLEELS